MIAVMTSPEPPKPLKPTKPAKPARRRRPLGAAAWTAVEAAWTAGWSASQIAEAFDVSHSQIRRRAHAQGWARVPRAAPPWPADDEDATGRARLAARAGVGEALLRATAALHRGAGGAAELELRLAERLAKTAAALKPNGPLGPAPADAARSSPSGAAPGEGSPAARWPTVGAPAHEEPGDLEMRLARLAKEVLAPRPSHVDETQADAMQDDQAQRDHTASDPALGLTPGPILGPATGDAPAAPKVDRKRPRRARPPKS